MDQDPTTIGVISAVSIGIGSALTKIMDYLKSRDKTGLSKDAQDHKQLIELTGILRDIIEQERTYYLGKVTSLETQLVEAMTQIQLLTEKIAVYELEIAAMKLRIDGLNVSQ